MISRPDRFCTIIGGPNGSGKSTIFSLLEPAGRFINADIIARRLNPEAPEKVSLRAGRLVLADLKRAVGEGENFVYETTLSSHQALALMRDCRAQDYEVALVFVALDSADLNVRRVAERVAQGGHDIPERVIRRRHESAFAKLPQAIRLADRMLVFDNSGLEPEMLLSLEFGSITHNGLRKDSALHSRLAQAVAEVMVLTVDEIFDATTPS